MNSRLNSETQPKTPGHNLALSSDINEEPQHDAEFGKRKLNEFSTPELRKRLESTETSLAERADMITGEINKLIKMQDEEEPLRQKLRELDQETRKKLGIEVGKTIFGAIMDGKLTPKKMIGVIGAGPSFLKAQEKYGTLKKMHSEGLEKGLEILKDHQKQFSTMHNEYSKVEKILNFRDGLRNKNQRRRRRQGF
jgi:hypothetical protein